MGSDYWVKSGFIFSRVSVNGLKPNFIFYHSRDKVHYIVFRQKWFQGVHSEASETIYFAENTTTKVCF